MLYSTYISNVKNLSRREKKILYNISHGFKDNKYGIPTIKAFLPDLKDFKEYKESKITFDEFKDRYLKMLETEDCRKALNQLNRMTKNKDIILLCFEKDFNVCHRKIIGDYMHEKAGTPYEELNPKLIKEKLTPGVMVETSDGSLYMFINNMFVNTSQSIELDYFNQNLVSDVSKLRIDKVYSVIGGIITLKSFFDRDLLAPIWVRGNLDEMV